MFGWFKKKTAIQRPAIVRAPFHDPILGTLTWDDNEEAWVADLGHPLASFRILIAGADRPNEQLIFQAQSFVPVPEALLVQIEPLLKHAAHEIPEGAHEILGLRIEAIVLLWPERPDTAMIYFDGPDTDERLWRCDYVSGQVRDLAFDD